MVKRLDVISKNWLRPHVWSDVAIIHSVERIEFDRVSFKVTGQKGGVDAIPSRIARILPLHIIQKDRDMRDVFVGQFCEHELIQKNLAQAILAARFHRSNNLHQLTFLDDEVVLKTHRVGYFSPDFNWHGDCATAAIYSEVNKKNSNQSLKEIAVDLASGVRLSTRQRVERCTDALLQGVDTAVDALAIVWRIGIRRADMGEQLCEAHGELITLLSLEHKV